MSPRRQAEHSIGSAEVMNSQVVGTTASLKLLLLHQYGADVLVTEDQRPLPSSHAAVRRLALTVELRALSSSERPCTVVELWSISSSSRYPFTRPLLLFPACATSPSLLPWGPRPLQVLADRVKIRRAGRISCRGR